MRKFLVLLVVFAMLAVAGSAGAATIVPIIVPVSGGWSFSGLSIGFPAGVGAVFGIAATMAVTGWTVGWIENPDCHGAPTLGDFGKCLQSKNWSLF